MPDIQIKSYAEIEYLVYKHIDFLSESTIPFEFWKGAAHLVRGIDMDDIPFVALSLFSYVKLWTGDKVLTAGLIEKGFKNIITTQEMVHMRHELLQK